MNKYMKLAKEEALKGITQKDGGPFGAVITDQNGNIIAKAHNEVLKAKDPTCHAEIMAIRKACQSLKSHDLTNCILYTLCEPCPMCLGAIIWANIKEVYYACTKDDAAKIGFRDAMIYEFIKGHNNLIELKQIDAQECFEVMEKISKRK